MTEIVDLVDRVERNFIFLNKTKHIIKGKNVK